MTKTETYSINMLKTFDQCPLKYEFAYIKNINLPENRFNTETGNKLHALINFYLKGMKVEKLIRALNEKEIKLWENFLSLNISECFKSEYSFNMRFEDFWLTGRIDAIIEKSGNYIIADWKTSHYLHNEHEELQTVFYLYAVYHILMGKGLIRNFSDISLIYYILSDNNQIRIEFDEIIYEKFKKRISGLVNKIRGIGLNEFKPAAGSQCGKCKFKDLCNKKSF